MTASRTLPTRPRQSSRCEGTTCSLPGESDSAPLRADSSIGRVATSPWERPRRPGGAVCLAQAPGRGDHPRHRGVAGISPRRPAADHGRRRRRLHRTGRDRPRGPEHQRRQGVGARHLRRRTRCCCARASRACSRRSGSRSPGWRATSKACSPRSPTTGPTTPSERITDGGAIVDAVRRVAAGDPALDPGGRRAPAHLPVGVASAGTTEQPARRAWSSVPAQPARGRAHPDGLGAAVEEPRPKSSVRTRSGACAPTVEVLVLPPGAHLTGSTAGVRYSRFSRDARRNARCGGAASRQYACSSTRSTRRRTAAPRLRLRGPGGAREIAQPRSADLLARVTSSAGTRRSRRRRAPQPGEETVWLARWS